MDWPAGNARQTEGESGGVGTARRAKSPSRVLFVVVVV